MLTDKIRLIKFDIKIALNYNSIYVVNQIDTII